VAADRPSKTFARTNNIPSHIKRALEPTRQYLTTFIYTSPYGDPFGVMLTRFKHATALGLSVIPKNAIALTVAGTKYR
jgi:hypothetical protein